MNFNSAAFTVNEAEVTKRKIANILFIIPPIKFNIILITRTHTNSKKINVIYKKNSGYLYN